MTSSIERLSSRSIFKHDDKRKSTRLPYVTPRLQVYGTVSELTMGNNTSGADTNMKQVSGSDRTIKENIVEIGKHPLGINLYLFDYKPAFRGNCGHSRQFGVMADEVEGVMPEAVSVHQNGYKQVNYDMLGIRRTVN
jgi:hypothetical protein